MSLNATIVGNESSGKFLQTSPPDAMMLVLTMEASFGDVSGPMRIAVPYYTMEPVLSRMLVAVAADHKTVALNYRNGTIPIMISQFKYLLNGMHLNYPYVIFLILRLMMCWRWTTNFTKYKPTNCWQNLFRW